MNTDSKVDCAVVIPAFNAARYLRETVESVLLNRGISIEIIIVDDGSIDETYRVADSLAQQYKNIRYFKQVNAGVSAARNAGFMQVISEYVCFLDSDDCPREGRLEAMHRIIVRHPEAVGIYGQVAYIDENSRPVDFSTKYRSDRRPAITKLDDILQGNMVDTPGAVLFRTSKLTASGLFDENIKIDEDWELYVRVARLGNFIYYGEGPVLDYRIHSLSAMHSSATHFQDYELSILKVFDGTVDYPSIDPRTLNRLSKEK